MADEIIRINLKVNKVLYPRLYKELMRVNKENPRLKATRLMNIADGALEFLAGNQASINFSHQADEPTTSNNNVAKLEKTSTVVIPAQMQEDLDDLLFGEGAFSSNKND